MSNITASCCFRLLLGGISRRSQTKSDLSIEGTWLIKVKVDTAARKTGALKYLQPAGESLWKGYTQFTAQSRNIYM